MLVMPRLACPSWPLDHHERDALAGHLNGVRMTKLMRREASANAGRYREVAQRGSSRRWRPRSPSGRTADDAQQRADRHRQPDPRPPVDVLPCPGVHAHFAPPPALTSADQDAAALRVEVALG